MERKDYKSEELFELATWENIMTSDGWRYFVSMLQSRKEYLEKQVILCVRSNDTHNAIRYEAKAEDVAALLKTVELRVKNLRRE